MQWLYQRDEKRKQLEVLRVRRGDKPANKCDGWEEWDGQKFSDSRDASRAFYYDNYKAVDLFPTYKWMAQNGYTKEQIKHAKAFRYELSITVLIVALQLLDGMSDYNPNKMNIGKVLLAQWVV